MVLHFEGGRYRRDGAGSIYSSMDTKFMIRNLYKGFAIILILYGLIAGITVTLPDQGSLLQSSRNIFYHVPLWFAVVVMMGISVFQSVRYLRYTSPELDRMGDALLADKRAEESARVGSFFIILGLLTGIIWSRVTWGQNLPSSDFSAWWVWDPIQICALVGLLIYMAYFLLRSSFSEPEQRGRVSAVYNIFAFAALIPLFFIVPKMLEGLHPTAADSEAGGGSFVVKGKIDSTFRLVLYPTMIG